ncbi:MAG: PQQ-like beta-propeller repeat protein [Polyangiaceae bacterium]|nr:PQQ-like beta-propeller repeat protein [Polyangiaceae bacterium]
MRRSLWSILLLALAACEEAPEPREETRQRRSFAGLEDGLEDRSTYNGIFGHSSDELFRVDVDTYEVKKVGRFDGCGPVIDIAVDGGHAIIGASYSSLYSIDPKTAKCTRLASGTFPNSLSFLPVGTVDPTSEALVGYLESRFVRIDPKTGNVTTIGSLEEPGLMSSGDIVSVAEGKTFLTVQGPGCDTDCLVEVNPRTGAMIRNFGPLGRSSVYGIAFWAGSVYGFSDAGELFEVVFTSDNVVTRALDVPDKVSFWGAGSTTIAPVRHEDDGPTVLAGGEGFANKNDKPKPRRR